MNSKKIRSGQYAQILTGLGGMFGCLWLVFPRNNIFLSVVCVSLYLATLAYFHFSNKETPADLGITAGNWKGSFGLNFVFLIVAIPSLYLLWRIYFPINKNFLSEAGFWKGLLSYPFWGVFQEYVFLGFFFRRYREVCSSPFPAILLSAVTFSLAHYPNLPLMGFCLLAGLVFSAVFNKYPNIFVAGLFHGVLAVFLIQVLLVYSKVGPHAEYGRWSSALHAVEASIDSVTVADSGSKSGLCSIRIRGWVASDRKIEEVILKSEGKSHPLRLAIARPDVSEYFHKDGYRNSGFSEIIEVAGKDPPREVHLEVLLSGEKHRIPLCFTRIKNK
ncbi:MAG: CPBP family intramembrane glutamic endopeptidase [Chthoniobacterales bacterium]